MTTSSHPDADKAQKVDRPADGNEELKPIFEELLTRSASILDLDVGQRRAWVSGMLSAWRSDIAVDDPDETDREFIAFVRQTGPELVGAGPADEIARVIVTLAEPAREADVKATRSWLVTDRRCPDERTAAIALQRQDSTYAIVASVVDGVLADLQVSGDVIDLLGGDPVELNANRPALELAEVDPRSAIEVIVAGWDALARDVAPPDLPESILANQLLARADLVALGTPIESLPLFRSTHNQIPAAFFAGCSETEIADGNRWAIEALTVALRPYEDVLAADTARDQMWQRPEHLKEIAVAFRGPLDMLSRREQDAIVYLEWADWVGAIVAIVSASDSARFDGETLIDRINAQPELTSAIQPSDRDYVAYGFDVALAIWADAGLLEDGQVVAGGRSGLVEAAKKVWASDDSEI